MAVRRCTACSKPLASSNPRARYCDSSCRANGAKRRAKGVPEALVTVLPTTSADEPDDQPSEREPLGGPVFLATLEELVDAKRENTALGRAALALAARIDLGVDTGSGLSSAVKTLGDTLVSATRGARRQETELDRVRRQRDEKRHA